MARKNLKRFVLYDRNIDAYAGFSNMQITIEEEQSKAVVFDERDNMTLKVRTYNTLTGLSFEAREI